MKRYTSLAILIVLSLILTACASTSAPTAAPETGPETTTETGDMPADMAADQTLRYAFARATLDDMDPSVERGFGRFIIQHLWLPPFIADPDLNLTPGTCTDYEVSEDGLTYTLHVDPEAVWSDGTRFTAQDIKAWFEYVVRPENIITFTKAKFDGIAGYAAVQEGTTTELEGIVVVDDLTLEITLSAPNPLFPYTVLADYNAGTAKADFAAQDPDGWWLNDPPVTGPYKIEDFNSDLGQFSFIRNENYWREQPLIERIEAIGVQDEATISIMFENGEIDVAQMLGEVGDQVAGQFPDSVVPMNYTFSAYWLLNPSIPPTDDPKVRAALIHAVDFREVVEVVFGDLKDPAPGPVVPNAFGFNPDVFEHDAFTYDPELARQELAESTYGSAENLPTLHLAAGTPQSDLVRGMEIVMEMWRENLGITNVETKFWWADWEQDENNIRDVHWGGMLMAGFPDAATLVKVFSNPVGVLARVGYDNPEVLALAEEALPLDRDSEEYAEKAQQAELMFLDDHVYKPYYLASYNYYVQPWVKNLQATWYNSWYNLEEVYIAEH